VAISFRFEFESWMNQPQGWLRPANLEGKLISKAKLPPLNPVADAPSSLPSGIWNQNPMPWSRGINRG
jgi:hypothetical protein